METALPVVEQDETRGLVPVALVSEVVRDSREGINRGDVRPARLRKQVRRDWKILIVLAG
jgi:hypothetical protein